MMGTRTMWSPKLVLAEKGPLSLQTSNTNPLQPGSRQGAYAARAHRVLFLAINRGP